MSINSANIKETPKFRLETGDSQVRIICKQSQPYKVLTLTYRDLADLLKLIDLTFEELSAHEKGETENQFSVPRH